MSELDRIIRERVSVNETAYLKVARSVQKLPTLRFADKNELAIAEPEFDKALKSYEISVHKFQLQRDVIKREIENYEQQRIHIEAAYNNAITVTEELESELAIAKTKRSQVEEYDRFTKQMVVTEKLRSREEMTKLLQRLRDEIKDLEAQKEEYARVWTARRKQFSEIVSALQGMQKQIREEKEEQDRREGMDETEEGEAVPTLELNTPAQDNSVEATNGTNTPLNTAGPDATEGGDLAGGDKMDMS